MLGISANGKEAIGNVVEDIFDRIALQFIGNLPSLKNAKRLVISGSDNFGLSHLFLQAMSNQTPNSIEKDVLKSLLESSNGYIQALKNKTKSNITESIDGIARTAKFQNRKMSKEEVQGILDEEFRKAGSHLQTVMESEGTKLRNLGTMMSISRVSSSLGDPDPTVYFIMVRDNVTCKECIKLHTINGITPRLWKFSELKSGYHKRGEENPSMFGLHPHCRCTLAYLSKDMGFNKQGKLIYVDEGYDLYSIQRAA